MNVGVYRKAKEMTEQRKQRLSRICEIVQNETVTTQKELIGRLLDHGIKVDQSVVSRDIQELQINRNDEGKYALPDSLETEKRKEHLEQVLSNVTDFSGEIKISAIKVSDGYAMAVSHAIEGFFEERIIGTITGQDTVLVVTERDRVGEAALQELSSMLI